MSRPVAQLRPYGDTGVLVELDGLDAVLAFAAAVSADPPAGVVDIVPAARTVLVRLDPSRTDVGAVARVLRCLEPPPPPPRAAGVVEIPVHYDGADLAAVGVLTGLGADGVVAAHTASYWTVAFVGFTPGFGYCTGGHAQLRVPRRDTPRTRVPAGSVGLAGEFTAAYPRDSPGGWQLVGRTDVCMWDLDRDPPALLRPGVQVRFTAVPGSAG